MPSQSGGVYLPLVRLEYFKPVATETPLFKLEPGRNVKACGQV